MKISSSLFFLYLFLTTTSFGQSFNKAKMDSLMSILSEKDKAMGSLAISKNGTVIYSNAIGYASINGENKILATTETKYRIGSITKMFTAVIIFQLIEENKLTLDITLDKYFPTIPNASKINIGQLLSHRSGIHNFTDDSLFLTYNQTAKTQKEMIDIITAFPPDFEPNTEAAYSNTNFVLLGYIAEKITKKTYNELVKNRIASKLNLSKTYVGGKTNTGNNECFSYSFINGWKQEPETDMSIPAAAGSILSTPVELNRFIEALFAGKLLSPESLEKMKTIKVGFGMGMFEIPFYNKKAYGHNGGIDGFGSNLSYFPKDSVSFAYCTNGQVYPMNDILIAALSIYFNRTYTLPSFNSVVLNSNDLDKYLGTYSSNDIPLKLTITKDNATLLAQATGQSSFPLEASDKDIFKFDRAGVVIEFNPSKNELTLKQGAGTYLFTKEK